MKAVIATLVLLASSLSYAQVTPATPSPEEQAASTVMMACSIEKYCAAGTLSPLDAYVVAQKPAASALFNNITCTDLEPILVDPSTVTALKDIAAQLTAAGQTTCLSTIP